MSSPSSTIDKSPLSKTEWTCFAICVVMVILIAIFGVFHSEHFNKKPAAANSGEKIQGRCVTADCMEAAAWLMGNMDDSIDPCENLYDRTCARFADQHPFKESETETSVLSNILEKNRERIHEIISSTPSLADWGHMHSLARLVNQFYRACIDQYERSRAYTNGGNPLVRLIQQQLGTAWWVSDSSRLSEFDWQAAMQAAAQDQNFIFFQLLPLPKANDLSKYVLEIGPDPSPTFTWNTLFGVSKKTTRTFKSFVLQLGMLLARDSGSNTTDPIVADRVKQFADDVVNVSAKFTRSISLMKMLGSNKGRFHKLFNYAEFKAQPNNSFVNWDSLLSVYSDNKLKLQREMPIVEHFYLSKYLSYSSTISRMLSSFSKSDPDFRRKMNNYFAFRIAFYWMGDLNYEYNHLFQVYLALFHNRFNIEEEWIICMRYVHHFMPKALGALYVSKYYHSGYEKTVSSVSEAVRKSLTDEIASLTWMDNETQSAAVDKLSQMTFKIGQPSGWKDKNVVATEMMSVYGNVDIGPANHYGNVRSLVKVLRNEEIKQLTKGSTPYDHWRTALYDVNIEYYDRWNEVLIPAGLLQPPLVSPSYPAYLNFGGVGSWIASIMLKAIDEDGQVFDNNYAMVNWWSQATWDNYSPMKKSIIDYYDNIVHPIILMHVNTTEYAPFAIAETGGLRMAYVAYKRYLAENKFTEQALPTIAHGNADQMFFYSYASTHCADYTSHNYVWRLIYGSIMPEYYHVNGGAGLMKEFASVFKCYPGSSMIPPEAKGVPQIY